VHDEFQGHRLRSICDDLAKRLDAELAEGKGLGAVDIEDL